MRRGSKFPVEGDPCWDGGAELHASGHSVLKLSRVPVHELLLNR